MHRYEKTNPTAHVISTNNSDRTHGLGANSVLSILLYLNKCIHRLRNVDKNLNGDICQSVYNSYKLKKVTQPKNRHATSIVPAPKSNYIVVLGHTHTWYWPHISVTWRWMLHNPNSTQLFFQSLDSRQSTPKKHKSTDDHEEEINNYLPNNKKMTITKKICWKTYSINLQSIDTA